MASPPRRHRQVLPAQNGYSVPHQWPATNISPQKVRGPSRPRDSSPLKEPRREKSEVKRDLEDKSPALVRRSIERDSAALNNSDFARSLRVERDLRDELRAAEERAKVLEYRVEKLTKERDYSLAASQSYLDTIDANQEQLERFAEERRRFAQENAALAADAARQMASAEAAVEAARVLRAENDALRRMARAAQEAERAATHRAQHSKSDGVDTAESERLRARIAELETNERNVQAMQAEREALQQQIAFALTAVRTILAEAGTRNTEAADLRSSLEILRSHISFRSNEAERLKSQYAAVGKRERALKELVDEQRLKIGELSRAKSAEKPPAKDDRGARPQGEAPGDREEELRRLAANQRRLQTQHEEAEAVISQLSARVRSLTAELSEKDMQLAHTSRLARGSVRDADPAELELERRQARAYERRIEGLVKANEEKDTKIGELLTYLELLNETLGLADMKKKKAVAAAKRRDEVVNEMTDEITRLRASLSQLEMASRNPASGNSDAVARVAECERLLSALREEVADARRARDVAIEDCRLLQHRVQGLEEQLAKTVASAAAAASIAASAAPAAPAPALAAPPSVPEPDDKKPQNALLLDISSTGTKWALRAALETVEATSKQLRKAQDDLVAADLQIFLDDKYIKEAKAAYEETYIKLAKAKEHDLNGMRRKLWEQESAAELTIEALGRDLDLRDTELRALRKGLPPAETAPLPTISARFARQVPGDAPPLRSPVACATPAEAQRTAPAPSSGSPGLATAVPNSPPHAEPRADAQDIGPQASGAAGRRPGTPTSPPRATSWSSERDDGPAGGGAGAGEGKRGTRVISPETAALLNGVGRRPRLGMSNEV